MNKYLVFLLLLSPVSYGGTKIDAYYTDPQINPSRPNSAREYDMEQIGVTGIKAHIYKGVKFTVEGTEPNTPSQGKFQKGDVILGVNGVVLQGKDPLVTLGTALTEAEATDGVLVFDIQSAKSKTSEKVTIKIPILGAYSKTYPLNCEKSKKIIAQAAEFYSVQDRKKHALHDGLACLFLLSTGDDKYIPLVKEYFVPYLNIQKIGENSWHNGYNGVACAEYYLRTGDKAVLPILQYYCDNARDRQRYGVGWGHWGGAANPSYESGGGMQHSAGNQILFTLVLGKMCGVDVDEKTLTGALRHWYAFAGHGGIPISDQRYWSVCRSAGRDGTTAAIMHIASQAKGDVTIYKKAKEYLAMSALTSWPSREYNWEVIWESMASHFMLDYNANMYYQTQQRFRWLYDLNRQASGGFVAHIDHGSMSPSASGISMALAFTAPLKNLQITGAPRSKYAKDFTLPEHLWGNEADLVFLSSKHNKDYYSYGKDEEIYIPYSQLPVELSYTAAAFKDLPLNVMLKNVRHARCEIRMGAAKALCMNGHIGELEKLLSDPDPRLRRAALDGINDCRPWFGGCPVSNNALPAEKFTPAMCDAITKILSNREEAWFVIDGALQALYHAPIPLIEKNIPNILPWTTHADWWLHESAFLALLGLQKDEALFVKHLPAAITIMINEDHYSPRNSMVKQLEGILQRTGADSLVRRLVADGLVRATAETKIFPNERNYNRSKSGAVNVIEAALAALTYAPETAASIAEGLATGDRLKMMDTDVLMRAVRSHDKSVKRFYIGFLPALDMLQGKERERVITVLFDTFRPELIKRFEMGSGFNKVELMNMIIDLNKLKKPISGWVNIGTPASTNRVWRYHSFDPVKEEAKTSLKAGPKTQVTALPIGMARWELPGFDDKDWTSGFTPIGKGKFVTHGHGHPHVADSNFSYPNRSVWGEGETLVTRTSFTLSKEDLQKEIYSLRILCPGVNKIYLNGKKIHDTINCPDVPRYETIILGSPETKNLKEGLNTLAVETAAKAITISKSNGVNKLVGQIDVYVEALKKSDLDL